MPSLGVEDVSLRFRLKGGREVVALDDVSLDGPRPRIRGHRRAVGLRQVEPPAHGRRPPAADGGEIRVDDRLVTAPGRDRGMVFQSYTLFPWLSVGKNVEFGPSLAGMPEAERMPDRGGVHQARSASPASRTPIRASSPAA